MLFIIGKIHKTTKCDHVFQKSKPACHSDFSIEAIELCNCNFLKRGIYEADFSTDFKKKVDKAKNKITK